MSKLRMLKQHVKYTLNSPEYITVTTMLEPPHRYGFCILCDDVERKASIYIKGFFVLCSNCYYAYCPSYLCNIDLHTPSAHPIHTAKNGVSIPYDSILWNKEELKNNTLSIVIAPHDRLGG